MKIQKQYYRKQKIVILSAFCAVLLLAFAALFAGSSQMTVGECLSALFGRGSAAQVRIMQNIRLPRILAAIIAGAGLSISGLVMQSCLSNSMASPSTLGVSNAAVFGANLSIIAFAGGFLSTGHNLSSYTAGANPFAVSFLSFLFAAASILLILGLCRIRSYRADVVVLAGLALGSVFSAATSLLQFFATDVGLSAAVIWSFGDLGRATYSTDAVMAVVVIAGIICFSLMSLRYNAMLSGDEEASALGVRVSRLRFFSLLLASLITAVCVSFLGVIGFVGLICPHLVKRIIGQDHRFTLPASAFFGSALLLAADTFARSIGSGSALPVGAITAFLGAPFFLFVIFSKKGRVGDA